MLDAREASIEIVEPTCEADVILVQTEDITAQVNNLTLDPGTWKLVDTLPVNANGRRELTTKTTNAQGYFRLRELAAP